MLVLSRKKSESVVIDACGGIEVMVVAVRGDKVRLGFRAPGDVAVHRKEVWLKIAAEAQGDGNAA
jgi:carbon storage regulator